MVDEPFKGQLAVGLLADAALAHIKNVVRLRDGPQFDLDFAVSVLFTKAVSEQGGQDNQ